MTLKDGKNLETRMWDLEEEVRKNIRWRKMQQAFSIIIGITIIVLFLLL